MRIANYWVYILKCENGSYYTGYTTNLVRRYQEHLKGTDKCKYTRSFKPVSIAQCWQVPGSKAIALKIERTIKKMSKREKEQLVVHPASLEQMFCTDTIRVDRFSVDSDNSLIGKGI